LNSSDTLDYLGEVAITGMTCRFPGAEGIDEFWHNLRNGVEAISFFSDQELRSAGVDPAVLSDPDHVKAAPVLEGIELFDASFFDFTPREAAFLDPQHRFFLECAWEVLESVGYDPETYEGRIGVYAGADANSYLLNNLVPNRALLASLGGHQLMSLADKDYLSTRVSYQLNLKGPSVGVQTACSTSLAAVHLACQSLLNGECDMALAGGVSMRIPQKEGYSYMEGGIVSPDGHCRAFDARAQGTIFGSGIGIVVLKRLADALADGNRIHAIIKGSAISNDGSLKVGYTAPGVDGQVRAISEALAMAAVDPETVTYIEAHGTGTELGDPIEIAALTRVFRTFTQKKQFCAIGSVKTNVGHLSTAAGAAGLIKTVLALKHKEIPPNLHFEQPNPEIDFANSPFYVNARLRDWEADGQPRRAGVSSFGMGGTNVHIVLEEAPAVEPSGESRPWHLLVLSARTGSALEKATDNLAEHLKEHPGFNLADVAYTLQVGRRTFSHRRVLVCRDIAETMTALETRDPQRVLTGVREVNDRPVVFMFPGLGDQYPNMALGLYRAEPTFRAHVDRCSEFLEPHLGLDLREMLFPDKGLAKEQADEAIQERKQPFGSPHSGLDLRKMLHRGGEQADEATRRLSQTSIAHPAVFVIEYALAQLLMEWGVHPQAMIGYSIGEYVAACLAGVFSLEDALTLLAQRAQMVQELPGGAMLAVPLSEEEVQPFLGEELSLSAINGPSLCILAGPTEAVAELESSLMEQGVACRHVQTSHAFHSRMLDPILEPLTQLVKILDLKLPTIPYVSNLTGTWITAEQATDPSYWAKHTRHSVRFADGIQELWKEPAWVLLEVGPGRTLGTLAIQHSASHNAAERVVSSLRHSYEQKPDLAFLLSTLGQLWLAGVSIDWQALYSRERRLCVPLPTYPFERQRYWIEPGKDMAASPASLVKNRDIADWFYIPVWKQSMLPIPAAPGSLASHKLCWLVFSDTCGLGAQLVKRLEQEEQDVITVTAGQQFAQIGDCAYTIHPQQRDDYDALLEALYDLDKTPHKIVHLWQVMPHEHILSRVEFSEKCQNMGFYSLLFLAQALAAQNMSDALQIRAVSNNMQEVTEEDVSYPEKATVIGPCRVIPQEYPHITCRSIDIVLPALGTPQEERLIDQLIAELTGQLSDSIVAYRGHHRWVQAFDRIRPDGAAGWTGRLREGGVYLITGGLGGVGLVIAEYLAQTAQAKLVLTRRSTFPGKDEWEQWLATHDDQDDISDRIRALQALERVGAEVMVASADVTNRGQMQAVLDEARARFGAVHGVIHAAGVPGEGLIQFKTPEMATAVLATKVKGVLVLDDLFKDVKLDFFVLFSSLVAILGEIGQVDYCAANAFLNAFALHNTFRNNRLTTSINWGSWYNVGIATLAPDVLKEDQTKVAILPSEGAEAFGQILSRSLLPQIVVCPTDLHAMIEQASALTEAQILERVGLPQLSELTQPRPDLRTPYVVPGNETERTLADLWQRTLGIEPIGVDDDFFELGGHSLLLTQVINRVCQVFKVKLPVRSLFEHPTVASIAQLIESGGGRVVEGDEKPIAERIRTAFPTERADLLKTYLKQKIALALDLSVDQIPEDIDLAEFDVQKITLDLIFNLKQDFGLQVFPEEIPRMPSIDAFARFIMVELDRLSDLTRLATNKPLSAYTLRPYRKRTSERSSSVSLPVQKNKPVAFIHSSPRAGSTLLRVMLAGHPNLFCPPELYLLHFNTMQEWRQNVGLGDEYAWAGKGLERAFVELLGITADESQAYIKELVEKNEPIHSVYRRLQELAEGRLLVDKTPAYSGDPEAIERAEMLFEAPRYIYLVRHPYAVVESFLRGRFDRLVGPNLFEETDADPYVIAETVWAMSNENLLEFLVEVEQERQHLVRYEELVSDPVSVMTGLCQFLGVPFDEAVLEPYDGRRERMTGSLGDVGDPNFFQHNRVDASRGEAWKRIRLPRRLDESTEELALQLGYELPATGTLPLPGHDQIDEEQLLADLDALSDEEVSTMLGELWDKEEEGVIDAHSHR